MEYQYNIGERLKTIMTQRRITIAQLAEATELSEDTIKAIRSGKTKNPTIQVIASIADALDCTIDGLLFRENLSSEEMKLVTGFRKLNSHGKKVISMLLESEHHMQISMTGPTREIPCITPAMAKTSDVDFSMHNAEYITLPAGYYDSADFAVRIISNMLYPIFAKGDMLAVEKKFPPIGSLGVFIDSQGTEMIRRYTEKDGSMYLETISSCNKSFFYTDDIICIGTIIGIIRIAENKGQGIN